MSHKWKVGDWCFCEMKLQQIKEMEGERVTCVTDSFFSLGSYDLSDRCFPLDLLVKNISDCFVTFQERIRSQDRVLKLNWPDINRWFVVKWVDACAIRNDKERLTLLMDEAEKFAHDIINKMCDANRLEVGGVALVRR